MYIGIGETFRLVELPDLGNNTAEVLKLPLSKYP